MKKHSIKEGDRFGRLVAICIAYSKNQPNGHKRNYWACQCDCGNIKAIKAGSLMHGRTKSCGCYYQETRGGTWLKHNLAHNRFYKVWIGIKGRCYNCNSSSYYKYGERNIELYEPWRNNVEPFIKYLLTLEGCDNPNLSIDRINTLGNYEPGNIRFADYHTQSANRRKVYQKSGYTGVFKRGDNRYESFITIDRKRILIGYFKTAREAVFMRNKYITDNNLWEYPIQSIENPHRHQLQTTLQDPLA